eukprot:CAMPEP_0115716988 /NCGR_PEP_ID=MMETSP0272-20121206/76630_1 /TAXON_ID=71861 /ORGANISM="Scrippsiella trochoidea, Strain CCMP3099" /LENGTH=108 /DNA_ID=CAMNT_0003159365 /DNA_START=229 /DNA_END=552 /DNA_ORIENTATION=-
MESFYGGLYMLIFMIGAAFIIMGEIFKVRPMEKCALKRVVDLRPFLSHTTHLRSSDLFHTLRRDIFDLRAKGSLCQRAGKFHERDAEEVDKRLEQIVRTSCSKLRHLF